MAVIMIVIGGGQVSNAIDVTPVIGSPQIDYPGFDPLGPLWKLYLMLATIAFVAGLLAAFGMITFAGKRGPPATWRRLRLAWLAWLIPIAGLRLLEFTAFGMMGPLHVPQPIIRFALVNGVLSATIIVSLWAAIRALPLQPKSAVAAPS